MGAGIVGDFTMVITMFGGNPAFPITLFISPLVSTFFATLCYNIFWWIIPLWLTDLSFYIQIYFTLPLLGIIGLFGARAAF